MKNLKTIGIAIGVVLLFAFGIFLSVRRQQTLSGKVAGKVVAVGYDNEDGRTRSGGIKSERVLKVSYSYKVNGAEILAKKTDNVLNAGSYAVGKQGTVCYDPKRPEISDFHLGDYACG